MSLQDLLAVLKQEYIADLPGKKILIEQLMLSGEVDLLETEFHKLKGTGKTYGVPEISRLGELVESICQLPAAVRDPIVAISLDLLNQIYRANSTQQNFDCDQSVGFQELISRVETALKSAG